MEQLRFDGKVAVITGAARGLGRSHAELLGQRGAAVVINDVAGADEAVAELNGAGITALASSHDISQPSGANALIKAAIDQFGHVDIVVNNAGIGRFAATAEETDDLFSTVIAVNAAGTRNVIHAVWPHFVERGYGRLINTTSGSGMFGFPGQNAYAASKGAVYGLTRAVALDIGSADIRVNALAPSAFTPMSAEAVVGNAELEKQMREMMPASLVSPAVAVLAHESCPVNGQVIDAGSGRIGLIYVADTVGYFNPALTPESLLENWSLVVDRTDSIVPSSALETTGLVAEAAKRGAV